MSAIETGIVPVLEVQCKDCGATITMPAHRFAANCPYCASPSVVDRPVDKGGHRKDQPDFILGFDVTREEATRRVEGWISRSRLFAPSAIKQAKVTGIQGIYLPAWLYGAVARSSYHASIGENYTTTETYTTTDSKGNTQIRTRTVTKTEYRKLTGNHSAYVLDIVVTASCGLGNEELETIEPFDLRAMRRYDAAVVSGWSAEEATLSRDEGFRIGRDEATDKVAAKLKAFMPGDSSTLVDFDTSFSEENTDLVLLPIYVFAARWGDDQTLRILVNGQTGEVQGEVPRSMAKILISVLLALGVIAMIALLIAGASAL
ncbi:MAG: hypothetical protein P8N31_13155 [Planctomycetota bacterium]|nr:hypothetical protein [Planctomycetota bacterium]MDG2144495.1 hypothetical protein [Planctomycetota bacterium]